MPATKKKAASKPLPKAVAKTTVTLDVAPAGVTTARAVAKPKAAKPKPKAKPAAKKKGA